MNLYKIILNNKKYIYYNNHKIDNYNEYIVINNDNQQCNNQNMNLEINSYNEKLLFFLKILRENIKTNNLYNLTNNLKDLKIIEDNKKNNFIEGYYNPKKNIIMINNKNNIDDNTLFHELLHLASTFKKDNIIFSGFFQYIGSNFFNTSIGRNLNEGYTEILNNDIFNNKPNNELYYFYFKIARIIEFIISKNKMEDFYFNANLYSLIKELEKYIETKKTINFLLHFDSNNFSYSLNYIYELVCNYILIEKNPNKYKIKELTKEIL